MTHPALPCPLCGHGAYTWLSGLIKHLQAHHPELTDRTRSDTMHEWMAQGGRR